MGPYKRGQPVNLLERFYAVDPVTQARTLADPTTVSFTILTPNGVETTLTYGLNSEVTKYAVGVYICHYGVPADPGFYTWESVGTGALEANSGPITFEVLDSDVQPADPTIVTQPGPCSPWINGHDVLAMCKQAVTDGKDAIDLDPWAGMASWLMWELSGRQFSSICERKVRPCRQPCNHFDYASGGGPWFWTASWYGAMGGSGWRNEYGDGCGCGWESYVKLAGYPVREILEVKIDGVIVDPSQYRLDGRKNLIRLADTSTSPPTVRSWPSCQDLSLDDDQPGTFSISYTWGTPPPELGRQAAAELAGEMYNAQGTGTCQLPSRVTTIIRNGIRIDRLSATASALKKGESGLPLVDMFLAAVNPTGMRRRPAVFTPDVQPYARRVGQDET